MSTISPITHQPTSPASPHLPNGVDKRVGSQTNRILGTFLVRRADADSDDGSGFDRWHAELVAGRHVGSRTGYRSLDDAVEAVQFLTKGNSASAAVLRQGDRFYAYQLEERDLDAGLSSPMYRSSLESWDSDSALQAFRKIAADSAVQAIVDGDFVHRFRTA